MKRGAPLKRYQALVAKTPMKRGGWAGLTTPSQKQQDDRAELEAAKRVIWHRSAVGASSSSSA